jgi:hypothetical protein
MGAGSAAANGDDEAEDDGTASAASKHRKSWCTFALVAAADFTFEAHDASRHLGEAEAGGECGGRRGEGGGGEATNCLCDADAAGVDAVDDDDFGISDVSGMFASATSTTLSRTPSVSRPHMDSPEPLPLRLACKLRKRMTTMRKVRVWYGDDKALY